MGAPACQPTRRPRRQEVYQVLGFLRRNRHERPGYELYCAAVAAARDPYFYATLDVPDTLDGRFDLVGLYVFLVIRRLNRLPPPGPQLAQAVFDAMFSDMDVNLREMGVGDMSIAKKVKKMWEAFNGRSDAYETALSAGDPARLTDALARNVWRGGPSGPHAATLAGIVRAQDGFLATQDVAALAAGRVAFLPVTEALP
jgi:cytochrome b pre-mRNA-processing protein 3